MLKNSFPIFLGLIFIMQLSFFSCENPIQYNFPDLYGNNSEDENDENTNSDEDADTEDNSYSTIVVDDSSFTIAWDSPQNDTITGYKLYYRQHGNTEWIELVELNDATTEYIIDSSDISYGQYDFAVTSLSDSEESEYHTSLEETAQPNTGWFLDWQNQ